MESTTAPALTRRDIPTAPQASSAWIARNGDFYFVPAYGHIEFAEDRMGTTMGTLLRQGWVQLSHTFIYVGDNGASQAQLDTLYDVLQLHTGIERRTLQAEYDDLLAGTL